VYSYIFLYIGSSWSLWRDYAKSMVVRSVLQAEKEGVNVIGLGALNKAHWLNGGGRYMYIYKYIHIYKFIKQF
jgi:hypothetical protein